LELQCRQPRTSTSFPEKNKLDVENEEDEDINADNPEEGKEKNEKVMHCNSVLKQMLVRYLS
jgi:hypothetical protein